MRGKVESLIEEEINVRRQQPGRSTSQRMHDSLLLFLGKPWQWAAFRYNFVGPGRWVTVGSVMWYSLVTYYSAVDGRLAEIYLSMVRSTFVVSFVTLLRGEQKARFFFLVWS